MDPSEVRHRILDEHEVLRQHLHGITRHLRACFDGADGLDGLREALRGFLPTMRAHMALEDRILAPALREADAFGDVRTEKLERHHDHLRERLDRVEAHLADEDGEALRGATADLVGDLWTEMAKEERDLLHPNILRDDVVSIGHSGG